MPPTSNSVGPTALRISSSFEKLVDGVPNAEDNINSTSTILILSILAQCMLCGEQFLPEFLLPLLLLTLFIGEAKLYDWTSLCSYNNNPQQT